MNPLNSSDTSNQLRSEAIWDVPGSLSGFIIIFFFRAAFVFNRKACNMAVSPSSRTSASTFRRILEIPINQCRLQAGDTRFDLPVTEITIGGCLICHSLPAWSDHNTPPVTPSELLSIDLQLSHFIICVHHCENSLVYIGLFLPYWVLFVLPTLVGLPIKSNPFAGVDVCIRFSEKVFFGNGWIYTSKT